MNWDPKVLARRELRGLWIMAPLLLVAGPFQVAFGASALVDNGHERNWIWIAWGLLLFGGGVANAFRIPRVRRRIADLEKAESGSVLSDPADEPTSTDSR